METANASLLNTMRLTLRRFREGRIPIHQCSGEIDAALTGLSNVDSKWKKAARSEWLIIEEINAITLDSADRILTGENRQIAVAAAKTLEKLIISLST